MAVTRDRVSKGVIATIALIALLFVSSFAMANRAYALDVWGAQTQLPPAEDAVADESEINLLSFQGDEDETVFLTVLDGEAVVARYLPHTIGSSDASGNVQGGGSVDVFTMKMQLDDEKLRSGDYKVEAFLSRASETPDYTGTLFGVWAALEGVDDPVLIGTRVVVNGEGAFSAPSTLARDGVLYELASSDPQKVGEACTFLYNKAGRANGAADGIVKYVDKNGATVATEKISKVPLNGTKDYSVPEIVTADNCAYRTMSLQGNLVARNPDAMEFSVPVALFSEADSSAQGHYLAKISMVADGEEIIADSVNVTGPYRYVAPITIYKTILDESGARQVHTYTIAGESTITLEPSTDERYVDPATRTRQVTFNYELQPLDALETEVTFNVINGQERAQSGNTRRQLTEPKKAFVNAGSPVAFPDEQVTVDGVVYNLAGDIDAYRYEYGSGVAPVVNAYYIPDGYEPPGDYEVTVSYVDYLSNQVISSEKLTSSPNSTGDLLIELPATLEKDGVTYERLPGQEEPIAHNYYSNIVAYAAYYHDASVPLEHDVVENVRVVYETAKASTVASASTAATAASGSISTASGSSVANSQQTAAAEARLNQNNDYNVVGNGAAGNRKLTNEAGVDSNEERIESDETALSSGVGNAAGQASEASGGTGLAPWVVPAAVAIAAIAVAGVAYALLRRRDADGYQV